MTDNENIVSDYYDDLRRRNMKELKKKIKASKDTILIIAGLSLIGGVIQMAISSQFNAESFILLLLVSGIYFGLAWFAEKKPLGAIVITLIIFLGIWAYNIIFISSDYIFKGLIIKAAMIYYLIKGIPFANEAENLQKEMAK